MKTNFKASKTVLALAVAGLISSGAFAAATDQGLVSIGSDTAVGELTYTTTADGSTYAATGTVNAKEDADAAAAAWDSTKHQLAATSEVTLVNGSSYGLVANGADASQTLTSIVGNGTIKLVGQNGADAQSAHTATLTLGSLGAAGSNITVDFSAGAPTEHAGAVTLNLTEGTLGAVDAQGREGWDSLITLKIADGTTAKVAASSGDLTLANVAFQNAGELTFSAADSQMVVLNSAFDNTVAGNTGKVTVENNFVVSGETGSFTTGAAYVGTPGTDDAADAVFKGTVTVGDASYQDTKVTNVFKAESLTVKAAQTQQNTPDFNVVKNGSAEIGTVKLETGTFRVGPEAKSVNVGTFTATGGYTKLEGVNVTVGTMSIANGEAVVGLTDKAESHTTIQGTLTLGLTSQSTAETTFTVENNDILTAKNVVVQGDDHQSTLTLKGTADIESLTASYAGNVAISSGKTSIQTLTLQDATNASGNGTFTTATGSTLDLGTASVGKNRAMTLGGTTTVNDLTIVETGKVTATGDVTINGTLTAAGADAYKQTAGTLTTTFANVATGSLSAPADVKAKDSVDLTGMNEDGDLVKLTDETTYTVEGYGQLAKALIAENSTKLQLVNGTLQSKTGGNETWANVANVGGYAGKSAIDHVIETGTTASFDAANTVGSINLTQKTATNKITSVTVGGTNQVTLRGDKSGNLVDDSKLTKADNYQLIFQNVALGGEEGDIGAYAGRVAVGTLAANAGDFTLGNIADSTTAGSGITVNDGSTLTILGEAATQTTKVGGTPAKPDVDYAVLTIGGHTVPAVGPTPANTVVDYKQGITVQNGGVLALGNYQTEAKAAYAKLHAMDLEDFKAENPDYTAEDLEAVKTSVLYIGQETYVNASGITMNAGNTYAVIDLDSVAAAHEGVAAYSSDRAILTVVDGTTKTAVNEIVFNRPNAGVVATGQDGDYINVGTAFAANTSYSFFSSLYEEGQLDANGHAAIRVDADEYSSLKDMNLHSQAAVDDALFNYNYGANRIADAIIDNWDAIGDAYDQRLFEAAKKAGLLAEGATLANFDDVVDGNLTNVLPNKQIEFTLLDQAQYGEFIVAISEAEHAVTNMAVLGGAFSTSFDINDQIRNTIDRRSSLANLNVARNATGITPWVDVMGTWNTADGLYGSSGY